MPRLLGLALAILAAGGCAHVAAPPPPSSQFFEGEGTVTLPDGRELPAPPSWVKRTVDPAQSTITQEMIQQRSFAAADPSRAFTRERTMVMKVTGSHFTLTETHGAFTGEGDLTGDPWRWTSWTSKAQLTNGAEVTSRDALDASGLQSDTEIRDAHGVRITITIHLRPIDEATFEAARSRLRELPAAQPSDAPPDPAGASKPGSASGACGSYC
jgi:hypothetical protein